MGYLDIVVNQLKNRVAVNSTQIRKNRTTQVATRCHTPWALFTTINSVTDATFKIVHVAPQNCYRIRFVYANWYATASAEINNTNNITVRAGLEYPSSNLIPVFFNGSRTVVIEPGSTVISDPVNVYLPVNSLFWSRSYVSVASVGQTYPTGTTVGSSTLVGTGSNSEGTTQTVGGDLSVTSGTLSSNAVSAFSPVAILGETTGTKPSILAIGDSIMFGQGDSSPSSSRDNGFFVRSLNNNYAYINVARAGDMAQYFLSNVARRRNNVYTGIDYALVEYGTNDIANAGRTFAQLQADLQSIWDNLNARGIKVFQSTILPRTTSSNGWTTTANQTPITGFATGGTRDQINAWIKTVPSPLLGVFDTASKVESGSGVWLPNLTADGTHPNYAGHNLMATAINTNLFI